MPVIDELENSITFYEKVLNRLNVFRILQLIKLLNALNLKRVRGINKNDLFKKHKML